MTYEQLLTRIIDDGIAEVKEAYPDEPEKRDGAIEGFEACRGKLSHELVELYRAAEDDARKQMDDPDLERYWNRRYRALQVEWVCNVISMAMVSAGGPPLLSWQPTARAAQKYADIVGVSSRT